MLSESVYNFAAASRRSTGGGSTADQDSDSQQYEAQTASAQLQLAASIQPAATSKPRNKRKNFKPISSRMAEVSDESDERDDDAVSESAANEDSRTDDVADSLDYDRKPMLLQAGADERQGQVKQRLNNNEVIPMDLSVATRPPSSEGDEDSGDSYRHKFILEQLRSQKLYSPGTDVSSCFDVIWKELEVHWDKTKLVVIHCWYFSLGCRLLGNWLLYYLYYWYFIIFRTGSQSINKSNWRWNFRRSYL